jgi:hypothetical protein
MKCHFGLIALFLIMLVAGCGQQANVSVPSGEEKGMNDWSFGVDVSQTNDMLDVKLKVKNETNEEAILDFTSGQQYEIVLKNKAGEELYRYSEGRMFTMAIIHETFAAGEEKLFKDSIVLTDIPPGSYTLEAMLLVASVNGEELKEKDVFQQSVEVEVNE